eukprot:14588707-Alexandrium_andersonii.AAC.1
MCNSVDSGASSAACPTHWSTRTTAPSPLERPPSEISTGGVSAAREASISCWRARIASRPQRIQQLEASTRTRAPGCA